MIFKLKNKYKKWLQDKQKLALFETEFRDFEKLNKRQNMPLTWANRSPKLHDRSVDTPFDSHYIYHPAWAARVIKNINPRLHIDFSSSLHFCTMLSAFVPTEFYDYRPADIHLEGLVSKSADLTKLIFEDNSIECLSCLHTLEHIGLGRYGDPIDPEGDLKAIGELQRVAKDHLLIVVPVGFSKVVFNAHRIYDPEMFIGLFSSCILESFSFVDDYGNLMMPADVNAAKEQQYACGCFHFRKKADSDVMKSNVEII